MLPTLSTATQPSSSSSEIVLLAVALEHLIVLAIFDTERLKELGSLGLYRAIICTRRDTPLELSSFQAGNSSQYAYILTCELTLLDLGAVILAFPLQGDAVRNTASDFNYSFCIRVHLRVL